MPQEKRWEKYFHDAPPQPGDEQQGAWPRKQLERMDRRFMERMEHAIARDKEHVQSKAK